MIIEIRKAGFLNKGAELMLYAILEKLRIAYPDAIFTMAPSPTASSRPFRKLVDAGLYPKASLVYKGIQWGQAARFAPQKLREMYGLVLDRDVDVVIDAAGFSYSDQWGLKNCQELARAAQRWRKQGTKVILMPQAFGPFSDKPIRKAIRRAVDNSDLVMPREQASYAHLTNVTGERPEIKQYPDFTNLVEGVVPDYFDPCKHGVCLVPNYRMVDKTDKSTSSSYLPFMVQCARYLLDRDVKPFILVHEGEKDRRLAEQVSREVGGLPILIEHHPLKIKGILGASTATIGSRFHGLVSALSQGVPSLATGWSHKYAELFRDYGFPEGVLSVEESGAAFGLKVDQLIDHTERKKLSTLLTEAAYRQKVRSESMWREVFAVIDGGP